MARRRMLAIRRSTPDGTPLVAIEVIAQDAGLHPELVERLVALGALEPAGGTRARPLYSRDGAARIARIARIRRDLGVNCAGALLAVDLLARIEVLEDALHRPTPRPRR